MKNLLLIFCFLLVYAASDAQSTIGKSTPKIDSTGLFHFVDMKDINGVEIKPNDLLGKVVVVNFWFIGCPPCIYEMPLLSKIADEYRNNKDVVFLAFSTDGEAALKEFFKTKTYNFRHIAKRVN